VVDNKNDFESDNRTVAFVDLLGFSSVVRGAYTPLDRRMIAESITRLRDFNFFTDVFRMQFSDCVVLITGTTEDEISDLLTGLAVLSCKFALTRIPLRGAITIGPIYHDEAMIIGPALETAYKLEQSRAIYPRILVDPSCLLRPSWSHQLRRGHDDEHFIDFLRLLPSMVPPPNTWRGAMKLMTHTAEQWTKYAQQPEIAKKWQWLHSYAVDALERYANEPRYRFPHRSGFPWCDHFFPYRGE
jgi:hypothetical protein